MAQSPFLYACLHTNSGRALPLIDRSLFIARIWAVVYLVGLIAGWNGLFRSGTANDPRYSGMFISTCFIVAMVWCWWVAIRIAQQRIRRPWGRVLALLALLFTGWVVGPLIVLGTRATPANDRT